MQMPDILQYHEAAVTAQVYGAARIERRRAARFIKLV
jgi:hypothetical protein